MSKNHFLKGTLILAFTGLFSRFIGFFYRIFLSHTIGAQGMGLYQLTMPLQALALAVTAAGMQAAISRLCASLLAVGKEDQAREHFFLGCATSLFSSLLLSFLLFRHSDFFAGEILKEPLTQPLVRLLALSFPLSALHNCINSYYYSRKETVLPSAIQLLEQAVRVGSSYLIFLILLSEKKPLTPIIAAGGTLAGEVAACAASLLALGFHMKARPLPLFTQKGAFTHWRTMASTALPHGLNRLLVTLLGSMEVIMIPQQLLASGLDQKQALGIYGVFTGMALPLILFPSTITNSASVMLMPSVAQLDSLGKNQRISYVISRTSQLCFFFGASCTLFFLLTGRFLGVLLFKSPTAGVYIRTLAFICPFLYMNTALASILNGLGRQNACLLHNVAGILVRISFVLFSIPQIGIRGYFYGMLMGELLLSSLHLFTLMRRRGRTSS
ncbi:MAG: oligosaccharide flippase family protein [Eubacteriales bacterium]|nr:oligosaccharide flippase family protein [Eubacteriales bacterium]